MYNAMFADNENHDQYIVSWDVGKPADRETFVETVQPNISSEGIGWETAIENLEQAKRQNMSKTDAETVVLKVVGNVLEV